MSLAILLTQCKVAGIHTLASSAHDRRGASPQKSGAGLGSRQLAPPADSAQLSVSPASRHSSLAARQSPNDDTETNEPSATNVPILLAPWEVDWCQPIAVLVGNEGAGLPEEVERAADARIHIPMASGVESLNAAAAATIVFYEAARQRNSTPRQL